MTAPGQVLKNRYHLLRELGRGGMGAVFLTQDNALGGYWVVKKLLIDDPAHSQQAIAQFKQEAVTLAQLNHRNLPRVSDFFEEAGEHYIVMEYVKSETLYDKATGSGLDQWVVMRYAEQLLQVTSYIHSQKVLHRDIKPQNILIREDDVISLVDFGLVKNIRNGGNKTSPFLKGRGSMPYASPEHWSGVSTTQQSDIYSIGATLFFALTGKDPVDADTRLHSNAALPLPSQLKPGISSEIDQAINKAMSLNVNTRFSSALDMKSALAAQFEYALITKTSWTTGFNSSSSPFGNPPSQTAKSPQVMPAYVNGASSAVSSPGGGQVSPRQIIAAPQPAVESVARAGFLSGMLAIFFAVAFLIGLILVGILAVSIVLPIVQSTPNPIHTPVITPRPPIIPTLTTKP